MKPAMQAYEAQVADILAESLIISDTTVSGDDALVKDNAWDNIWTNADAE